MKKLVSLVLALLMVLGTVSALAEPQKYSIPVEENGTVVSYIYVTTEHDANWDSGYYNVYSDEARTQLISEESWNDNAGTYSYKSYEDSKIIYAEAWDKDTYIETNYNYKDDGSTLIRVNHKNEKVYTEEEYNKDGVLMNVYRWDEDGGVTVDGNGDLVNAFFSFGDGYVSYDAVDGWEILNTATGEWEKAAGPDGPDGKFSQLYDKALDLLAELQKEAKKKKAAKPETTWYSNNTACVHGISLREAYPGLTSKWYNALPVDISKDGTQTFDLVASNLYHLGSVTVTVKGDEVTTTYAYPSNRGFNIYPVDECLAWFKSVDEITGSYLENPTANAQFGKAVSKANDLGGQDIALLFICNHVTYRVPLNDAGAMPTRFWKNSSKFDAYYASVNKLMEQLASGQSTVVETK